MDKRFYLAGTFGIIIFKLSNTVIFAFRFTVTFENAISQKLFILRNASIQVFLLKFIISLKIYSFEHIIWPILYGRYFHLFELLLTLHTQIGFPHPSHPSIQSVWHGHAENFSWFLYRYFIVEYKLNFKPQLTVSTSNRFSVTVRKTFRSFACWWAFHIFFLTFWRTYFFQRKVTKRFN